MHKIANLTYGKHYFIFLKLITTFSEFSKSLPEPGIEPGKKHKIQLKHKHWEL